MNAEAEQATRSTSMTELRQRMEPRTAVVKAGFTDSASFELAQRAAKALSASDLVPQNYQGNIPNCLIALEMAQRIGASPLMVAQNLYVVHGRPAWSAKFLIASFNQCGRFSPIKYRFQGTEGKDDWGCRAYAKDLQTGEELTGPLITIELAKAEGWHGRNGSKWKTIPELMLRYRAAAWMVNTHAPEISMGLNTAEEVHDVYDAALDPQSGAYEVTTESLREAAEEVVTPEAEPQPEAEARDPEQVSIDTQKPHGNTINAAVAKLEKAPDIDTLNATWNVIRSDFKHKGYEVTLEVEAKYQDMKDHFEAQQ